MTERLMWKAGGMRAAGIPAPDVGLPKTADVVVIGGGMIGASVAYHLAVRGVAVVLLERHVLGSGTTWHAAGQVAQMRGSPRMYPMSMYAGSFYERIEDESPRLRPGFIRCGSLNIAQTPDRMTELHRSVAHGALMGVDVAELTADEVAEFAPGIRTDDLIGGVWIPRDGRVNPTDALLAVARAATRHGATFVEGVEVHTVKIERSAVAAVVTNRDEIATHMVIDCAGLWSSRPIASIVPGLALRAVSHWYCVTEQIDALRNRRLPVVRDPDAQIYVRDYNGALLVGAFEVGRLPTELAIHDRGFVEFSETPPNLSTRFHSAAHRFPMMARAGVARVLNAPESFTADGRPLVGHVPEVDGLIVAAGLNSEGIIFGPGIGRTVAEIVIDGKAGIDTIDLDPARFDNFHDNPRYLQARTAEALGMLFEMKYPHRCRNNGRQLRLSPLHAIHLANGARFADTAGWEVPVCYHADAFAHDAPGYQLPRWYRCVADELRIARTSAGIADLSFSDTRQLIGGDVVGLLAKLTAGAATTIYPGTATTLDIPSPTAGVAVRAQLLVTPDEQIYLVCPAGSGRRLDRSLRAAAVTDFRVNVCDASEKFVTIGVIGPRASDAMAHLPGGDRLATLDEGRIAENHLGYASLHASRMEVGGLSGWQLRLAPSQAASMHRELLCTAGELGGGPVGSEALKSLRVAAGEAAWGHEFTPDTPRPDATVDLVRVRVQSANIVVTETDVLEKRNGTYVATLTSVGYDPTDSTNFVGLARLPRADDELCGNGWTVHAGGHRLPAEVTRCPVSDLTGRCPSRATPP